jgi:hypothetical protein
VGKATAYKIWELRKSTEITPEILATFSHLKMEKVLPLIYFSTSQEIALFMIENLTDTLYFLQMNRFSTIKLYFTLLYEPVDCYQIFFFLTLKN